MINQKTLFVVGAGASQEFGLPLGSELKHKISRALDITFDDWGSSLKSGDADIVHALRSLSSQNGRHGNINEYLPTCRKVKNGIPIAISIDNFINDHHDDQYLPILAKMAIIKTILIEERKSKLYHDENSGGTLDFGPISDTWLANLFSIIQEGIGIDKVDGIFENVRFITFNYDRIIEQFLSGAIVNYYGLSVDSANEIVKKLDIVHPYGCIGAPFRYDPKRILFGSSPSPQNLLNNKNSILTFSESVGSEIEEHCRGLFNWAETVCFVGMAYHRQNLRFVGCGESSMPKRIVANNFGISSEDFPFIRDDLSARFPTSGVSWSWDGNYARDVVSNRRRYFQARSVY